MRDSDQFPKALGEAFQDAVREQTARAERVWYPQYVGRELEWLSDVLGLAHSRTGELQLWAAQRAIVEALFEHRFVSVYSCRGPGKTHVAAALALAFFYTEPSRVLVTAPGLRHVREVFFATLAKLMHRAPAPLAGELTTMALRIDAEHAIIGIPARDPEHVRGHHAAPKVPGDPDADELSAEDLAEEVGATDGGTRLLIIVDEAASVDAEIFRVLEGIYNKPNVYVLMLSNPTLGLDDPHPYVRVLTHSTDWHRVKISAFSEEQYGDPMSHQFDQVFDRVPRYLISARALDRAEREHEPNDPIFLSDWLGQFCSGSTESSVVTRSILHAAMAYYVENRGTKYDLGPRIGIDIGTGSPDPCTASLFFDGVKRSAWEWRPAKDDSETRVTTATEIAVLMVDWGRQLGKLFPDRWDGSPITGHRVSIDDTANPGVCDILSSRGIPVDRVNFARSPDGHWPELRGAFRFKNVRAEMHWLARRGLQEGVFAIDPEKFPKSAAQATWARYSRETDGMGTIIKIEPKPDIVRRHGHSPDHWDADILAMRQTDPGPMAWTEGGSPLGLNSSKRTRLRERTSRRRLGWTPLTFG